MTPSPFLANLVGVTFRPAPVKRIIEALQPGTTLLAERQYDNAYDSNAIRVYVSVNDDRVIEALALRSLNSDPIRPDNTLFIGYIEKGVAAKAARFFDEGYIFTCEVKSATGDAKAPWLLELKPTGEKGESPVPESHLPAAWEGIDEDIPF